MTGELIHYKHLIEQYLSFMDFKNFFSVRYEYCI